MLDSGNVKVENAAFATMAHARDELRPQTAYIACPSSHTFMDMPCPADVYDSCTPRQEALM